MTVSEIMKKMILKSAGNRRDINHFLKVYSYAKMIGELEGLDEDTQFILETSAIVHDISLPLCREKYGSLEGYLQEKESASLLEAFFTDTDIAEDVQKRVIHLISHHHTYEGIDGLDYQILLEADYLVNADEGNEDKDMILKMRKSLFKTQTGIKLLNSMYHLECL